MGWRWAAARGGPPARGRARGGGSHAYRGGRGGNLALPYPTRRRPALAGVVASSPQLRLAFQPPAWKTTLGRLLFNAWPSFSMPSGLERAPLSHAPSAVRAYAEDPLVHDRVTPRLGIGLIDGGEGLLDSGA